MIIEKNANVSPSSANTRIVVADVLRGIAIGGIVLLHFVEHMSSSTFPELTKLDKITYDVLKVFLSGKMYAIFAMLFGLTLFIQHDNQVKKRNDFRCRFIWRMLLLMMFGLIDMCFFNGDILFLYGVCGILVMPLVRASDRFLCIIAGVLFIQPLEIIYIIIGIINPDCSPLSLNLGEYYKPVFVEQEFGTFWGVAIAGLKNGIPINFFYAIESGRLTQTIFLMILGQLIGRKRLLYYENNNKKLWIKVLKISLCLIVLFCIISPLLKNITNICVHNSLQIIVNMWRNMSIAMVIITIVLLAFYANGNGKKYLLKIAPYGRMSLTNYIGQSIVGGFLFYNWGLGLCRICGHFESLLLGVLFVAVQCWFCSMWLKKHNRGPIEGLWHKATWVAK